MKTTLFCGGPGNSHTQLHGRVPKSIILLEREEMFLARATRSICQS